MRFIGFAMICLMAVAALTSCSKEAVSPVKAKSVEKNTLMDTPPDSVGGEGGQKNPVPPPPPPPRP